MPLDRSYRPARAVVCVALGVARALAPVPAASQSLGFLHRVFSDGAVLQRDRPLPVWGRASPGETVRVTFAAQSVATTADADTGAWRVVLAPEPARGVGGTLRVVGDAHSASVRDVVVGDVWLCSGQSNMSFALRDADGGATELATAHLPDVRILQTTQVASATPRDDLAPSDAWNPAVAGAPGLETATAIGYFFAKRLHTTLGVPIGVLQAAVGSTPIEAWMSRASLAAEPLATDVRLEPVAVAAGDTQRPCGLYNAMIAPYAPYALRGVLWYQGESHAFQNAAYSVPGEYGTLLRDLVLDWRAHWSDAALPFLVMQLPDFGLPDAGPDRSDWSLVRAQQLEVLALPATGVAVSLGVVPPDHVSAIHPPNKDDFAALFVSAAQGVAYNAPAPPAAPVLAAAEFDGATVRLSFRNADQGLATRDGAPPHGFALAGDDGVFHWASAVLDGEQATVVVAAADVAVTRRVRYAWADNATDDAFGHGANLVSRDGLFVGTFESGPQQARADGGSSTASSNGAPDAGEIAPGEASIGGDGACACRARPGSSRGCVRVLAMVCLVVWTQRIGRRRAGAGSRVSGDAR